MARHRRRDLAKEPSPRRPAHGKHLGDSAGPPEVIDEGRPLPLMQQVVQPVDSAHPPQQPIRQLSAPAGNDENRRGCWQLIELSTPCAPVLGKRSVGHHGYRIGYRGAVLLGAGEVEQRRICPAVVIVLPLRSKKWTPPIETRMASPHAPVRTQGVTFAGRQSGAGLAVIEQQGFPDQPASHPASDQGDPEVPILELCLPGFVETSYRQPVIAMKNRGDAERIEVTQQSGMKTGGTMQPMLLSDHLDPAIRQANARVSLQQDQALFQIGGCQTVIRIQAADIAPSRTLHASIPRCGWPTIGLAQDRHAGLLESIEEVQCQRVIRTIVDQNYLEVLEALPGQAIERAPQIPPMVEAGNDHTQQGLLRIPRSGWSGNLPERRSRADIENKMDQVPSLLSQPRTKSRRQGKYQALQKMD